MFNKKLKTRISALERELGYAYIEKEEWQEELNHGSLRRIDVKIKALIDYLDIEDIGDYSHVKYGKKNAEKNA